MPDPTWNGTVPPIAVALVKKFEQFRAAPYQDGGGVWTIGYGTTRGWDGQPITADSPQVDEIEACRFLDRDLGGAAGDVHAAVKVPLIEREAGALISWDYNLGAGNLNRSTMLAVLNKGQRDAVPGEMGKWINDAGRPVLGLRRRRWAEAAVFVGLAPDEAYARAWAEINAVGDWPGFGV